MTQWDVSSLSLQLDPDWHIVETAGEKGGRGYRFYPDQLKGEGLFIAALRKNDGDGFSWPKKGKNAKSGKGAGEKVSRQEAEGLRGWVDGVESLFLFRHEECIHALPSSLSEDLLYLQASCYLKRAGIPLGRLTVKEFIPEHDLALSVIASPGLPTIDLSKEEAIRYLRREDIRVESNMKGWALVRYEGQRLGWVKLLGNRINNYYPKDWRILKRDP